MPPIRVLHIITRLIVGGAQENTLFTAELLDASRYQVDLISGSQTGSEGSLVEEARSKGIPLTIVPHLVRQISPFHDLLALLKLTQIIRRGQYTIVHTHSSKAGILGRLAARLARTPIIVHTVHGWSFHDYMSPLTRKIYIGLEQRMAKLSDALIVVAEQDIAKGLAAGIGQPNQYHLIRSSIPLEDFDPAKYSRQEVRQELGLPTDAPVIGNVGRFSPQKNPLVWAQVAGLIGRALPQARFLLVGDGPLRHELQENLAQEGIAERTVLTGLRRDVPRLLAAMDIFLLTSLWEGLPRVIPQAMAMRLPIVAARVDGIAEAVQNGVTGYLFDPDDTNGIAQACVTLINDLAMRQAMGARGRELALKNYDLRHMLTQIDSLYQHLLEINRR
ncbi:MAG: glycosyltransferase family 4 protein [Anaerolineales bacterium]|nr:glycosyltransferase family 4 protein [Anaerolineales bacterium]